MLTLPGSGVLFRKTSALLDQTPKWTEGDNPGINELDILYGRYTSCSLQCRWLSSEVEVFQLSSFMTWSYS